MSDLDFSDIEAIKQEAHKCEARKGKPYRFDNELALGYCGLSSDKEEPLGFIKCPYRTDEIIPLRREGFVAYGCTAGGDSYDHVIVPLPTISPISNPNRLLNP